MKGTAEVKTEKVKKTEAAETIRKAEKIERTGEIEKTGQRTEQTEKKKKERLIYEPGDVVRLKKKHPCGSFEWEILRVGADFKLKCLGCGHIIMVERRMAEKNTRELRKK